MRDEGRIETCVLRGANQGLFPFSLFGFFFHLPQLPTISMPLVAFYLLFESLFIWARLLLSFRSSRSTSACELDHRK